MKVANMGTILTIQFPENFEQRYNEYKARILGSQKTAKPQNIDDTIEQKIPIQNEDYLKSIHLISASLEPTDVIFLVLDKNFQIPIRCVVKNRNGELTYIKKLYNIAYFADVPNKRVTYDKNIADSINNGLFRKRPVARYMSTNKFKKPTLVQKSGEGTLVLKNDITIKTGLIKHDVPLQYQSLYIDKTK